MDIVGRRKMFLALSGVITLICFVSIILFGFKLSIEFTGGSVTEIVNTNKGPVQVEKVKDVYKKNRINVVTVRQSSKNDIVVRTETISDKQKNKVISDLNSNGTIVKQQSFNTLGPVIGGETRINALKAVAIAIVAITLYIAFAFRKISKPVSSWKFGISAIIALVHDVVIVMGAFSILGHLFNIEIDTLFITAVLTIMGFSVHDTIVVFDRIRENLIKNIRNLSFEEVVNNSFNETLARSLNTSITVIFVLLSLLLFGGESIRWFIVAFLVGIITGTYSSIFVASAILVEWYFWDKNGSNFSKFLKLSRKSKK